MHALIADDDRGAALILSRTLASWGIDSVVVHNGRDAWDLLQNHDPKPAKPKPTLGILDWMMPGLDGIELCRRIRADAALDGMYLLLLTARGGRDDLLTGLQAGADDYLVKPFDHDELRARVQVGRRVLGLQRGLAERVAQLERALSQVKQLQGLLPICCYCKRIRTDQNYWQQVDSYISEHSEAQFSHGICPPCYENAIKELDPAE